MWFDAFRRWQKTDRGMTSRSRRTRRLALERLEERALLDGSPVATLFPNDPHFAEQWGLHNIGQLVSGVAGTPDADIDAPEAWAVFTGTTKVIVASIDTGVDYNHPDLYKNIWLNQGEIPLEWLAGPDLHAVRNTDVVDVDGDGLITFWDLDDPINAALVNDSNGDGRITAADLLRPIAEGGWEDGISNDGDEFVDDLIGWNFGPNPLNTPDPSVPVCGVSEIGDSLCFLPLVQPANDPMDDNGHGTGTSGVIGAIGNNGLGIAGLNWRVQIMVLRAGNLGILDHGPQAVTYATTHGAAISNNSYGSPRSPAFVEALNAARDYGHIVVAATGNLTYVCRGITRYPVVAPRDVLLDNIVGVGSTTNRDQLFVGSARGDGQGSLNNVLTAAPGALILTTDRQGSIVHQTGSSIAAPHVAGAMALVWGLHPDWNYQQVIHQVAGAVDFPPPASGILRFDLSVGTGSEGRLNVGRALTAPTINGDRGGAATDDNMMLRVSATDSTLLEVLVNGELAYSGARDSVPGGRLIFNGLAGVDTLTVDFTKGNPLPSAGISFDGQDGADELRVVGGSGFSTAEYRTYPALRRLVLGDGPPILVQNTVESVSHMPTTGTVRLTTGGNPLAYRFTAADVPGTTRVEIDTGPTPSTTKTFAFTFTNPTVAVAGEQNLPRAVRLFPCGLGLVNSVTIDSLGSGFDAAFARLSGDTSVFVEALRDITSIDFGNESVAVVPRHTGTSINLGGSDAPGTIGLSMEHLNRIRAGTIQIGHEATNIAVSGALDLTNAAEFRLFTNENMVLNPGAHLSTGESNLALRAGRITVGRGALVSAGAVTVSATELVLKRDAHFSANAGDISIAADRIAIDRTASIQAVDHAVTILPTTSGLAINLGGADAPGVLGLTDAELDRIRTGDLTIDSSGPITVSAAIQHAGDANLRITSERNIVITRQGGITSQHGDVTLVNVASGTSNVVGIDVNGGTLRTTGRGNILLSGHGGNDAQRVEDQCTVDEIGNDICQQVAFPGTSGHVGVWVRNGAAIFSTARTPDAGSITIEGTGGEGIDGNMGVRISGAITRVRSLAGAIAITGTGGQGSGRQNAGVFIGLGASVIAGTDGRSDVAPSTALVTITGAGGAGTADNHGVWIADSGLLLVLGGGLEIRGLAGAATEPSSIAIAIVRGAIVFSEGDAALTAECGADPANQLALDIGGRAIIMTSRGRLVINGSEHPTRSLRSLRLTCGS